MIKVTAVRDSKVVDFYYIYLVVSQIEAIVPNDDTSRTVIIMTSGRQYTVLQSGMRVRELIDEFQHPRPVRRPVDRRLQHYYPVD